MIRLPKPWTRQPQIPVGINRAAISIAKATFVVNGAGRVNVAKGVFPTAASTAFTQDVGLQGRSIGLSGTGSWSYSGQTAAAIRRLTIITAFRSGATLSGFADLLSTSTTGGTGYRFESSASGSDISFVKSGVIRFGTLSVSPNTDYVCVASHEEASGAYYIYLRNLQTGAITSSSGTDTNASGAGDGNFSIGFPANGAYDCKLYLGAIVEDYYPIEVTRGLLFNPWALFAPLPRRIFVDAPSGVANPVGFGTDTLKQLTEVATGRTGTRGTASNTLRALTESATGVVTSAQVGFAAGTLKALTDSATGRTGARGTAADTLKALTEQATGFTSVNPVGFATDTLKALTETATGRTGVRGTAADTLRAFNEAATGLAGVLGNARDTLKALTESATGTITSNAAQGFAAGTLRTLTDSATGRAGAIAGAVDTFKKLTEQAQGRTGMVGFSVDSLKALQAAAGAVSGAQPIAPPGRTGGAPIWWPGKPGGRPWWYRDLKEKTDELERMRQLRIEMGILPKAEAKRIAKVVKDVDAFIEEVPTEATADEYIVRAEALTERINALVDKIEEDDDEQTIMEMSRFFFHHRTGARECRIH